MLDPVPLFLTILFFILITSSIYKMKYILSLTYCCYENNIVCLFVGIGMYRYLFVFLLLSCGGSDFPRGDPAYLVEDDGEEVFLYFSRRMDTGHHCFYEKKVRKAELVDETSLVADATPRFRSISEMKDLAEGCTLLTPKAVDLGHVATAIVSPRSKSKNYRGNSVYLTYYWYPPCVAGIFYTLFFRRWWVTPLACTPFFAGNVIGWVSHFMFRKERVAAMQQITSSQSIFAKQGDAEKLRKTLTWLESKGSVACPTRPKIDVPRDDKEDRR